VTEHATSIERTDGQSRAGRLKRQYRAVCSCGWRHDWSTPVKSGAERDAADHLSQMDDESCTQTASCEEGDHTYTWPCDFAPGTGRLWSNGRTQRDAIGEAIVHVREYQGSDPVALEYWARMLAAEVKRLWAQ
jgi:hypothetical protein